jgi:hypothetical protein
LINNNATNEWDYPGVLNVMNDGSLIVIYGYHVARLNPATGAVEASTALPTGQSAPRDTAYNGYDALPDGTIIAKTVNRQKGCTENGFSAFLQCPDPSQVPLSVMVAIDPTTLKVISQITLPEMMGGRVTTAHFNGKDYIYLPGTKSLYRYTFQNGKFAADPTWGPVSYLKSGQTAGSAMAVMGDHVVAMTNRGAPTSTPMSVVAVSQADASKVANLEPFSDSGSKNSFIPSMVSVDPTSHLIFVMHAGAGKIGAVALNNGSLSTKWTQDQTTLSFTTLIGPSNQRVLIGTNIPVKGLQAAQELHHRTGHLARRRHRQAARRIRPIPQDVRRDPRHAGIRGPAVLPHGQRAHHRVAGQPRRLELTASSQAATAATIAGVGRSRGAAMTSRPLTRASAAAMVRP